MLQYFSEDKREAMTKVMSEEVELTNNPAEAFEAMSKMLALCGKILVQETGILTFEDLLMILACAKR